MTKYKYDMYKDGVTQTFLGRFMECREQCRLSYIEGWRANGEPDSTAFGSASHYVLSRIYETSGKIKNPRAIHFAILNASIKDFVKEYERLWKREHTRSTLHQVEQLEKMLGLVEAVMPHYIARCCQQDSLYGDFQKRKWVALEETFEIPFRFNDGRITVLRGRMDGVYEEKDRLWLFESKNLTRIDGEGISDTLPMNLQVCMYLHAMRVMSGRLNDKRKIGGVLYNVIRRPGLRMADKDTLKSFLTRVSDDISHRPDHYFMRFRMPIIQAELDVWYIKNFVPMMHDVQRWYDDIRETGGVNFNYMNANSLIGKYGRSGLFDAITKNDFSNCSKRETPFSELVDN